MIYKDLFFNNKKYTIYYVEGTVVGKDKNLETHVSGGGGGGYNYQGTGASAPISISSSTTIHDKIYLSLGNGKEQSIEVENWDIACREGHRLLFAWVIKEGEGRGPYVGMLNYTTDTVYVNESSVNGIFASPLSNLGCSTGLALLAASTAVGWFIGSLLNEAIATLAGGVGLFCFLFFKFKANSKFQKNSRQLNIEVQGFLNSKQNNP